jgi:hypothetical protein
MPLKAFSLVSFAVALDSARNFLFALVPSLRGHPILQNAPATVPGWSSLNATRNVVSYETTHIVESGQKECKSFFSIFRLLFLHA